MNDRPGIVLASSSAIRAAILQGAGLTFDIVKPGVDEARIKEDAARAGAGLEEIAMLLAEAKCLAVAGKYPGLVIGSDQILEFRGEAYDKPNTVEEARARLRNMQGETHTLINAVALARDGKIIWRRVDRPKLAMRRLKDAEIDLYLADAGPEALQSVGAYQIEKTGARLFDRIEGDHFAVLGLSLFPLLEVLRREGAIEF